MRRTSPRLKIFRQLKRKEFEFVLHIFETAAHQTLDRVNCALRRFDQILACGVADYYLIVLVLIEREGHDRGHQIQPVFSRDHDRGIPLHIGHERIRGAEIDADDVVNAHL